MYRLLLPVEIWISSYQDKVYYEDMIALYKETKPDSQTSRRSRVDALRDGGNLTGLYVSLWTG
jgi:hypothetical protein